MKPEYWKQALELIGMAAIVGSLVFLAMQIRQERILAYSEITFAIEANAIDVRAMIAENIDLWVRGCAGADLSDAERIVFNQLITNLNDRAYYMANTYDVMDIDGREVWVAEFAGFLAGNAGAYESWHRREEALQRFRSAITPNNRAASAWMQEVESAIDRIREAGE